MKIKTSKYRKFILPDRLDFRSFTVYIRNSFPLSAKWQVSRQGTTGTGGTGDWCLRHDCKLSFPSFSFAPRVSSHVDVWGRNAWRTPKNLAWKASFRNPPKGCYLWNHMSLKKLKWTMTQPTSTLNVSIYVSIKNLLSCREPQAACRLFSH